jgi:hypothetical protein
VENQVVS